MPTYFLHGFKWPRANIRIHIILQNLEDAAAEWLMAPPTTATLLDNFKTLHPDAMAHLPNLRFIEQYDPEDETTTSQPHAYIADIVHEARPDIDVKKVQEEGMPNDQWQAMTDLRDKVAEGAEIGWYVVVCGDTERAVPPPPAIEQPSGIASSTASLAVNSVEGTKSSPLRKLFAKVPRKMKSSKSLRTNGTSNASSYGGSVSGESAPPVPSIPPQNTFSTPAPGSTRPKTAR